MLSKNVIAEIQKANLQAGYLEDNSSTIISYETAKKRQKISFEACVKECWNYITEHMNVTKVLQADLTLEQRKRERDSLIEEFVMRTKPTVEGYENKELRALVTDLQKRLTEYDVITDLLIGPESENIDEVRINGIDQIFYVKNGKLERLNARFSSEEVLESVIDRLLMNSNVRLVPDTPFVDARTIEGYRVNAVHSSITKDRQHALVIRKFKKNKLTAKDIIERGFMTSNMFKFLIFMIKSNSSLVVVGKTGSGKTTLVDLITKYIDWDERIISIENPSELDLKKRKGDIVINDVLQLECKMPSENPSPKEPTLEHLIENAMRQSPTWIIPGELRRPEEFDAALTAALTGHSFVSTFHAGSGNQVIYRFVTAYIKSSKMPLELAMREICEVLNFIVIVKHMKDNIKRCFEIIEVEGVEGITPKLRTIYKFEIEDVIKDEYGHVKKFVGKHIRKNPISKNTYERFIESGISKQEMEFLISDSVPEEVYEWSEELGSM